jgi:hypothetical protein
MSDVNHTAAAAIYAAAAVTKRAKEAKANQSKTYSTSDGSLPSQGPVLTPTATEPEEIVWFDELPEEEQRKYRSITSHLSKVLRPNTVNRDNLAVKLYDTFEEQMKGTGWNPRIAVEIYFNTKRAFSG